MGRVYDVNRPPILAALKLLKDEEGNTDKIILSDREYQFQQGNLIIIGSNESTKYVFMKKVNYMIIVLHEIIGSYDAANFIS